MRVFGLLERLLKTAQKKNTVDKLVLHALIVKPQSERTVNTANVDASNPMPVSVTSMRTVQCVSVSCSTELFTVIVPPMVNFTALPNEVCSANRENG